MARSATPYSFSFFCVVLLCSCKFGDFTPDAGVPQPIDSAVTDAPDSIVDASPFDGGDATPILSDAAMHDIGELNTGLSTLVGSSLAGYVDGPRDVSLFSNPVNMIVGPDGNLYVADFDNNLVRRVTPEGVTSTLVSQANFGRPYGMAFTPAGVLFVQTDRNSSGELGGALWSVSLTTGVATLQVDNIGRVRGLAALADGRLVISDSERHTVRIYNPTLASMVLLAGEEGVAGFADGTGAAARFNRPVDIIALSSTELLVADSLNNRLRKITITGIVSTLAGSGLEGNTDGLASVAEFNEPVGLAKSDDGSVYISEFDSGRVRKLSADASSVSTIAGSTPGFADNVDPLQAQLFGNEGIEFEAPYLYISDGNNGTGAMFNRIRRLDLTP